MGGLGTIVLMEEDHGIRRGISAALSRAGFDVVEADTARDAAVQLRRGARVLLCDYHVRLGNGQGLLKWARKERPKCLRVLLTAESDMHVAVDALELGTVARFVVKSWDPQAICGILTLLVETPRTVSESGSRRLPTARSSSVLLVDDDNIVRKAIATGLTRYGFDVQQAADGAAALHSLSPNAPEVALVDLVLPSVAGTEVIQFIKACHPSSVVVAMSGLTNPDARDEAFRAGADDFISKPIDLSTLARRVDGYLQMGRVRRTAEKNAERAERAELYAREMSSLLAHDLRNGFAVAESNLHFAADAELPAAVKEALGSVRSALRRMSALADNLTAVDMLDETLVARRSAVDVVALLRRTAEVHVPTIGADDVSIEFDVPRELSASVDPHLLERILHNLLNNACRYVDDNGRIRLRAMRRAVDKGVALVIEIGNTGSALPESLARQIFERGATAGSKSRTGLGLYFCRMACAAHDGSISCEKDGDLTANFVVQLALRPEAGQSSSSHRHRRVSRV